MAKTLNKLGTEESEILSRKVSQSFKISSNVSTNFKKLLLPIIKLNNKNI